MNERPRRHLLRQGWTGSTMLCKKIHTNVHYGWNDIIDINWFLRIRTFTAYKFRNSLDTFDGCIVKEIEHTDKSSHSVADRKNGGNKYAIYECKSNFQMHIFCKFTNDLRISNRTSAWSVLRVIKLNMYIYSIDRCRNKQNICIHIA